MSIPDRWLDYKPLGKQIKGTRFIAFKVPLSAEVNKRVANGDTRLEIPELLEKVPNLGMIIDLTYTTKYYRPNAFIDAGIKYVKLMIPGKEVPKSEHTKQFSEYVNSFINDEGNEDKLIGVHCTHGVNRTGYLICHHMVTVLKMHPDEALREFELARGHKLERVNYRKALIRLTENRNSDERDTREVLSWRSVDRHRDYHNRSRRDTMYQSFGSNRISSNRDPLPSNDFGSRYSVMADLYAERNSPPRNRYSWRRL